MVPAQPQVTPSQGPLVTRWQTDSYLDIVQHHQRPVDTAHRLVGWGGGKDTPSAPGAGDAPTPLPPLPPPNCGRQGVAASPGQDRSHPSAVRSRYPGPYPRQGPSDGRLLNRSPGASTLQEGSLFPNSLHFGPHEAFKWK